MDLAFINLFLPLAQAAGGPAPGGFNPMIIMMMAVFALLYFIVLRPNNQEKKKREEMLNTVSKGDQVVTVGGVHGTVESVDIVKGIVAVTIAPKVTVRVNKTALATITRGKNGKEDEAKGD